MSGLTLTIPDAVAWPLVVLTVGWLGHKGWVLLQRGNRLNLKKRCDDEHQLVREDILAEYRDLCKVCVEDVEKRLLAGDKRFAAIGADIQEIKRMLRKLSVGMMVLATRDGTKPAEFEAQITERAALAGVSLEGEDK